MELKKEERENLEILKHYLESEDEKKARAKNPRIIEEQILRFLTKKYYLEKGRNSLAGVISDIRKSLTGKLFGTKIWQDLSSQVLFQDEVYDNPDKNLGKLNKKYDGIYQVPYSWLSKQLSIYGYDKKLLDTYMDIVDEAYGLK